MKYIINAELDVWVNLIDAKLTRRRQAFKAISNDVRSLAILDRLHEMGLAEKKVDAPGHCAWSLNDCFGNIPCLVAHDEPPKTIEGDQQLASLVKLSAFDVAVQRLTKQSVLSMIRLVILTFGLAHPKLVPPEEARERNREGYP